MVSELFFWVSDDATNERDALLKVQAILFDGKSVSGDSVVNLFVWEDSFINA